MGGGSVAPEAPSVKPQSMLNSKYYVCGVGAKVGLLAGPQARGRLSTAQAQRSTIMLGNSATSISVYSPFFTRYIMGSGALSDALHRRSP